jgi:cytochrome c oxidase assembly factor CtaG
VSLGAVTDAVYLAPPRPSWSSLLGHWSLDPMFVLLVLAGVLYVTGVDRLARRGRQWQRSRSLAFLAGLVVIFLATQSGLAQYDRTLFSFHVVQHVALGMVAPLLLVLGAPVTLTLQAAPRRVQERLVRVLRSRPVIVVTHPVTVWALFGGTLVVLYFTGLYELSLQHDTVHAIVHVHFVAIGFLFMGYVVGIDPLAFRMRYGARLLYVLVLLPFHAFLGAALLGTDQLLAPTWTAQVVRNWGPSALDDQRLGAGILWAAGELLGVVALTIVLYQWMRHEERLAARLDRRLAAESVGREADARGLSGPAPQAPRAGSWRTGERVSATGAHSEHR